MLLLCVIAGCVFFSRERGDPLKDAVEFGTQRLLDEINAKADAITIADLLDMQRLMKHLRN